MISRIRLDGFGLTPQDVADTLYPHADHIEALLGVPVSRGEFVVERDLAEPVASLFAFKGRLLLHPDTSGAIYIAGNTASSDFPTGGVNPSG